jgi:transcriptional regulator of nitric oxide reductase
MAWQKAIAAGLCSVMLLVAAVPALAREFSASQLDAVFPLEQPRTRAAHTSGTPPVARITAEGELLGYVFSTFDISGSLGYSGKPVDILVGLSVSGRIIGSMLLAHEEPILIIGVAPEDLDLYVSGFAGFDILAEAGSTRADLPEFVSGATVSSGVIGDGIVRSARTVANALGLAGESSIAERLDRSSFESASWQELLADGSIAQRILTRGDLQDALDVALDDNGNSAPDDLFIDLYAGLMTPPRIGQNLIGQRDFNKLTSQLGARDNAIFVAANGLYSFKGTGYVRSGTFDRIQIVQGATTIRLLRSGYENLPELRIDGAPEMRELAVFTVPEDTGFNPLAPWRLDLIVTRETQAGGALGAVFELPYVLPSLYRLGGASAGVVPSMLADTPLWQQTWLDRRYEVAALILLLTVFAAMLFFQDSLVRNDRVYRTSRIIFLAVTLVWLGWIAGAQLSVVNIITFSQALLTGFEWTLFLLDPLVFLLWGFVAVALLFWGRGVYCGWLCPFGALQELLSEIARKLKVPQIKIPFVVHERLWPIKYVVFLGLFAVSLGSVELAFRGAEVEPFKTAISLMFMRDWPYVVYAVALLGAGLFIERFYCRYLCPLGAALAIPARLRMFDWLRRRPQCGNECKICATHCTVQAIHPNGEINPNECIHCLSCQRFYYDKTNCPPLIVKEKRRLHREEVARKASLEQQGET